MDRKIKQEDLTDDLVVDVDAEGLLHDIEEELEAGEIVIVDGVLVAGHVSGVLVAGHVDGTDRKKQIRGDGISPGQYLTRHTSSNGHYLSKGAMMHELALSNRKGKPTKTLVNMFILLANKIGGRTCFRNVHILEDMKAEAVATMCLNWHKFDVTKYDNPFGFFTRVTLNKFFNQLKAAKKERVGKGKYAMSLGSDRISWECMDLLGGDVHELKDSVWKGAGEAIVTSYTNNGSNVLGVVGDRAIAGVLNASTGETVVQVTDAETMLVDDVRDAIMQRRTVMSPTTSQREDGSV